MRTLSSRPERVSAESRDPGPLSANACLLGSWVPDTSLTRHSGMTVTEVHHAEPAGAADGGRERREVQRGETFSGNRGLAIEEPLIFEIGRTDTTGVDLPEPPKFSARLGKLARTEPLGLPGLSRARGDAPFRAPEPEELRHRHGHLSARLVHHEAQPAPQREDGAAAGLRRHPSAAAALHRAGRDRADRRVVALAVRTDRHAGDRHDAQGRRARRTVRHDGDQGGAGGARREAIDRAGAESRRTAPTRRRRRCLATGSRRCHRATTARSIPKR